LIRDDTHTLSFQKRHVLLGLFGAGLYLCNRLCGRRRVLTPA
jgi:hypothetical protein